MITYGYQIQKEHDPLIKIAETAVDTFSRATLPAAFLVDTFPIRTKVEPLYMIRYADHLTQCVTSQLGSLELALRGPPRNGAT